MSGSKKKMEGFLKITFVNIYTTFSDFEESLKELKYLCKASY